MVDSFYWCGSSLEDDQDWECTGEGGLFSDLLSADCVLYSFVVPGNLYFRLTAACKRRSKQAE